MGLQGSLDQFTLILQNDGVIKGRTTRIFDDHSPRLCGALKCVWARGMTIVCHLFRHLYGRGYLSDHLTCLAIHRSVRQTAIIFSTCLLLRLLFELIKRHLVMEIAAWLVNHFNTGDFRAHVLNSGQFGLKLVKGIQLLC